MEKKTSKRQLIICVPKTFLQWEYTTRYWAELAALLSFHVRWTLQRTDSLTLKLDNL